MALHPTYSPSLELIQSILQKDQAENHILEEICQAINENLEHYNWVGFYFMNHATRKLHLGPYVGAPTDHTIIDFGKGICGQVALSGDTFISADVNAEANYIACSIDVKSEIVVPMYQGEKLIGQIDIDSHKVNRFSEEDEQFLNAVNQSIVNALPSLSDYIASLIQTEV